MNVPTITVFTPTYNRAYILGKCYQSLRAQTCKDFEWLVIDDGSTDETKDLVAGWMQQEQDFQIRYIYKENGGLHTGYNTAIANMETQLSVCIDSDDAMPASAVETILTVWAERKDEDVAGIVGLDFDTHGNLIGKPLPEEEKINAATLLCVPGMGDKKYVMRNDLWKQIAPMPVYPGERNFNPHYFVIRLSRDYKFVPLNQCLCEVDYQENGMSANIYRQYINSPKSFAALRRAILEVPDMTFGYRFKTAAHYVSSCMFAKQYSKIWFGMKHKLLILAASPLGYLLYVHILLRNKLYYNKGF